VQELFARRIGRANVCAPWPASVPVTTGAVPGTRHRRPPPALDCKRPASRQPEFGRPPRRAAASRHASSQPHRTALPWHRHCARCSGKKVRVEGCRRRYPLRRPRCRSKSASSRTRQWRAGNRGGFGGLLPKQLGRAWRRSLAAHRHVNFRSVPRGEYVVRGALKDAAGRERGLVFQRVTVMAGGAEP
jgi:hypothetical protein